MKAKTKDKWEEVKTARDNAAIAILSFAPMHTWPNWIASVIAKLEELDAQSEEPEIDDGIDFRWVVLEVRALIDRWLEEGDWA